LNARQAEDNPVTETLKPRGFPKLETLNPNFPISPLSSKNQTLKVKQHKLLNVWPELKLDCPSGRNRLVSR
jgi:hypothetical protein